MADVNASDLIDEILEVYGRPAGKIGQYGFATLLPVLEVRMKSLLTECDDLRRNAKVERERAGKVAEEVLALAGALSGLGAIETANEPATLADALSKEMLGIVREMDREACRIIRSAFDRETSAFSLEVGFFEEVHRRAREMVADAAGQEELAAESIRVTAERMAKFCAVGPGKEDRVVVATLLRTTELVEEKLEAFVRRQRQREGKNEPTSPLVSGTLKRIEEIRDGLRAAVCELVNAIYVTEGRRRQVVEKMTVYRQFVCRIEKKDAPLPERAAEAGPS